MADQTDIAFRSPSTFVTLKLARLQNNLNAQATALLKEKVGLSLVEWRVIQMLRMHENAFMTELAELAQMDKGQLSRKIKSMVAKGLLRVETDADDKRMQHIRLTEAALEISAEMMPTMQKRQALLVAGISEEDLETFYAVVAKMDAASKVRDIA